MGVTEDDPRSRRQEQSAGQNSYISIEDLKEILRDLHVPTPLQGRILGRTERQEAVGVIAEIDPKIADEYLREVTQNVFGFSIQDLSPAELRQIEYVRKTLGIPGEFDPSA